MRTFLRVSVYIVILGITLYRCFFNLGKLPPQRWDEQTNIHVVNTIVSKQLFPALLLDGSPFFEKPPLWYWSTFIVSVLFPNSITAIRSVSAASGLLFIMFTVWAARWWWGDIAGIVSWAILITTDHLFVNNPGGIFSTHTLRSADLDSLFILFLVLSFIASLTHVSPGLKGIATGTFSALAILTKGPLGLLPFIFLSRKSLPYALVLCALLVIPWYAYMTAMYGWQFISTHIFYHLVQRSIVPIEGHNNPWWYFISILTNRTFFLSWEIVAMSVVWLLMNGLYTSDLRIRAVITMLLLCLIIPTATQTRLAWYILPFYPFAALTVGAFAESLSRRIPGRSM